MVPSPALTVVTLGVADVGRSAAFYQRLGFSRKFAAAGEEIAFFAAGGIVLALFGWDKLAEDAAVADHPRPQAFRGTTLAWNCNSRAEVDAAMAHALASGAEIVRPADATSYGGYRGYFTDPDGHAWEVVQAPGIVVSEGGKLALPD